MRFHAGTVDRPGRYDHNDIPGGMNESMASLSSALLDALDHAMPIQVAAIRNWTPERRIRAARRAWERVLGIAALDAPEPFDRSGGACRGVAMDPPAKDKQAAKAAKARCRGCPIAAGCRTYALRVAVPGVWGGLTRAERAKRNPHVYLTWSGGADLLFGGRHQEDEFNALVLVLAVFAYQPGGVTFASRHWCTDHAQCLYAGFQADRRETAA